MEYKLVQLTKAKGRIIIARVWGIGEIEKYWSKGTKFVVKDE